MAHRYASFEHTWACSYDSGAARCRLGFNSRHINDDQLVHGLLRHPRLAFCFDSTLSLCSFFLFFLALACLYSLRRACGSDNHYYCARRRTWIWPGCWRGMVVSGYRCNYGRRDVLGGFADAKSLQTNSVSFSRKRGSKSPPLYFRQQAKHAIARRIRRTRGNSALQFGQR